MKQIFGYLLFIVVIVGFVILDKPVQGVAPLADLVIEEYRTKGSRTCVIVRHINSTQVAIDCF